MMYYLSPDKNRLINFKWGFLYLSISFFACTNSNTTPTPVIEDGRVLFDGSDAKTPPDLNPIDSFLPNDLPDAYTFVPIAPESIQIRAQRLWTCGGYSVKKGESITVKPLNGQWTMSQTNYPLVDHKGYAEAGNFRGCIFGSLVAVIGLNYTNQNVICIQDETTIIAKQDGILYLGPNDGKTEDNQGEIVVSIKTDKGKLVPRLGFNEVLFVDLGSGNYDWVDLVGNHIVLTVPSSIAAKYQQDIPITLNTFDTWYLDQAELAGARPYQNEYIQFVPDETVKTVGALMIAGNPILMDPIVLDGEAGKKNILKSHDNRYSVWGFVHEMGHDFTLINEGYRYMVGDGPTEAWANLFTLFTLNKRQHPEAARPYCEEAKQYLASTKDYSVFKKDPWIPLCMLMELQNAYGWEFYQSFFAYYNQLNLSDVPKQSDSDEIRWKWIRDTLNRFAPEDVTPVFIKYNIPISDT